MSIAVKHETFILTAKHKSESSALPTRRKQPSGGHFWWGTRVRGR